MPSRSDAPIFVVGSYRSGTSIFSWCMGQHPNIVHLPETNWLARLTLDLDNLYRLGTINGHYSHLSQAGVSKEEFYRLFGGAVDSIVHSTSAALLGGTAIVSEEQFGRRRSLDDPKKRWLDATPENSHYILPLSQLFPEARFIHLLRNPDEVARSLMRFSRTGGRSRDYSLEEAYRAWLRLTQDACKAEYALGSGRMIRIHYEDLVNNPEQTFRQVLEFLGEEYSDDCKRPLRKKLNSSNVDEEPLPARTAIGAEAMEYYKQIRQLPPPEMEGDPDVRAELQAAFDKRCKDEQAGQFASAVRRLNNELHAIYRSTSWRVTWPIRMLKRLVASIFRLRYLDRQTLRLLARDAYYGIPLSDKTRRRLRNVLGKIPLLTRALRGGSMAKYGRTMAQLPEPVDVEETARRLGAADAPTIELACADEPDVTIVIPVFNNVAHTYHCLSSIARNMPEVPIEVLVVDDCSTDGTAKFLASCSGVKVLRNQENLGFIGACNAGAHAASGRFIHFLNNDTQVAPGWLDELYRTFESEANVGLVGSKLVYPDGRLQEAGGIIWQDGSAWNFGRLDDPSRPEYNYLRDVDYISGASILVSREKFLSLGGFDNHYAPAYCEDSDLAFRLRQCGLRVLYQPLSVVFHYEGVTSGVDTDGGIKRYQVTNTKKFYERWKDVLKGHRKNGIDADLEKERAVTRRALVIDACTPTPDQDAGSVTAFYYLKILRDLGYKVTFIPDNLQFDGAYTQALQRLGIECIYAPYCQSIEDFIREKGRRFDLALLYRPYVAAQYIDLIRQRCPETTIIYDTVDLHYLREQRQAEIEDNPLLKRRAEHTKALEFNLIDKAHATIVVSPAEKLLLDSEKVKGNVHVVQLVLEEEPAGPPFSERKDVLFIGGYRHPPNVDAVNYFVNEVLPLVRERIPGVTFYALGSNPPEDILSLQNEYIRVPGYVEDIAPYFNRCRVMVAPLRYGAGVKGKIGTAFAFGLPVVATEVAVEGMGLSDGVEFLAAESAEDLACQLERVYFDEALWYKLSDGGRDIVRKRYSPAHVQKRLRAVIDSANEFAGGKARGRAVNEGEG